MALADSAPLLDALLDETRVFAPPAEFVRRAGATDESIYARGENFQRYWERCAEELDWHRRWTRTLAWNPPRARWFEGGRLNAAHNCVDRHVEAGLGEKLALVWEGEPGDRRRFTYRELRDEVARFASALRMLGVRKGDRVAIYLPMIPEAVFAMLACARLGAPHSVVFGGFSAASLADRIADVGAKTLITADYGYRRGRRVPLKENADQALESCPKVESVVVVQRDLERPGVRRNGSAGATVMVPGRDHWHHELRASASQDCPPEPMDSEDALFILYTSGTTGKPKGIVHSTGGYLVQVSSTAKLVFDLRGDDVFWCTADVGWITGHSYVVYGPLANAATIALYEGAPDEPDRGRFWKICEELSVTILYTAPTAIRAFMAWGDEWPAGYDLSSLRLLGSVGEPINPEAWMWYREAIGGGRCPIVDTWWQTETGAMMLSPIPGLTKTRPGSVCRALPGIAATILDEAGREADAGYLAITQPWPGMLRGIYGDDERYRETYWSKWDGIYFPGDGAKRDADGYLWILGRVDDVLNVAGHRIGTMEVESALVSHPEVAEAAVVGAPHPVKGQGIAAFVTCARGASGGDALRDELKAHVSKEIGPIARPQSVLFAKDLPKTRSGKIMRRLLGDIASGRPPGDTTTLADPEVVRSLQRRLASGKG